MLAGAAGGSPAPLRSAPLAATAAVPTAHRRNCKTNLTPQPRQQRQKMNATQPLREIVIDRPQNMKRALNAVLDPPAESALDKLRSRLFESRRTSESTRRRRRSSSRSHGTRNTDDDDSGGAAEFVDNVVVSAKYTVWNFFPRVLLAQFKKPSNVYFLFIAMLQTIKEVSNTNGVPTILLPLTIVFICSAIKEALEDRERHRADAVMNSRLVLCLSAMGDWEYKQWGDVQVGDIVKVLNDETVPADLFMLATEELDDPGVIDTHALVVDNSKNNSSTAGTVTIESSRNEHSSGETATVAASNYEQIELPEQRWSGNNSPAHKKQQQEQPHRSSGNVAYIETKSLDGETNLKIRTAIPLISTLTSPPCDLNALRGVIECEAPNNRIATFDGNLTVSLNAVQAAALGLRSAGAARSNALSAVKGDTPKTGHHLLQQLRRNRDGSLSVRVPITAKQMVLRSCVLRNTRAIVGVAIFTGHETKVFCSNTEPVVKTSSVEQHLNTLILRVVCIQQLVCLLGALLGAYWMVAQGDALWYLHAPEIASRESFARAAVRSSAGFPFRELVKLHVRYFIIMQNFVPISLNVSLEFVKYWQAYFIEQDLDMYDAASDTPALVRSSALNEDLGRVHHIFTDKTGTLTMNLMLFRFCTIAGKHYGGDVVESDANDAGSALASPHHRSNNSTKASPQFVQFDPTELFADLRAGGRRADEIRLFLRHLALCHTLIPSKPFAEMCTSASPEYSASSPDEQALVSAAAHCNVRFVHRTPSAMTILEPGSADEPPRVFKLLNLLEFDSDRKRMSVIIETPEGEIELLCKGADNVILERLAGGHANDPQQIDDVYAQLSLYAKSGMRTLCLAHKTIDRAEYEAWSERFAAAMSSIDELVKRRQGLPNAIDPLMHEIELDLRLLGVTAVQDKLQDGVPKTLQLLQETGMKVWTLTGDKMETAINIGYACSLLSSNSDVLQVASDEYIAVAKGLQDVAMRLEKLSAVSSASRQLEAKRRRRMQQQQQQTLSWHQQLRVSLRALVLGAPLPPPQKKKRPRVRKAPRQSHTHSMYSPVSTLDRDDATAGRSDADDDDDANGSDDERGALLRGRPMGLFQRNTYAPRPIALVIDGKALEHALRPRLRPLFYQVTKLCSSVICCRVSPKQKADVVDFVRFYEPESITLAIGDGANDVGMIQAAHVGVGISGQEGMQAVNSSDYAISQFRFLQRLLFVHGRWAYRRVAKLMSYMLYKNVTYVLTTFWFGCFCGFSGQPLILDVAAQSFNVLYTSLPLVLFAVLDQDISSESAAQFPYLYALGQKNVLLARRVFWPWILNGIWHSVIIFFVSAWGFQGDLSVSTRHDRIHHPTTVSPTGLDDGLNTLGFVVFTNLVIVVNLKLVLEAFLVTWHFVATILASIALWFGVAALLASPTSRFHHAVGEMTFLLHAPVFWALCALVVALSLLRDLLWKFVRRLHYPSTYHILQEREMLSMTNSPRSMASEHRAAMWSDVQVPVLDYSKMLRQIPQFESAQESFMRSSPLAESLISGSGGSGDLESASHVRARASFHVPELYELLESSSSSGGGGSAMLSVGGSGSVPADSEALRHQYHGYAFSEDENVDSDVEAASVSSPKDKFSKLLPLSTTGVGRGELVAPSSGGVAAAGSNTTGGSRAFKKMLKSVRGPKNA